MDLRLDHVTVAARDLDVLRAAFEQAGVPTEYGGRHSNDVTHMAIVGFRDGTYLELVSAFDVDAHSPLWHDPIHGDGGPCAWAVGVDDIAARSEELLERGVAVDGPHDYEREREDGTLVEWELAFLGEGDPGATLPFLIEDRTPREYRVTPTDDLADAPVAGVETVVLAVRDRDRAVERFQAAFDLAGPRRTGDDALGANVAVFQDAPVTVAEPTGPGWLAARLDAFGPRPAAYLLARDPGAETPFDVREQGEFTGREVEWLDVSAPVDRPYLGVVESDANDW